MKYTDLPQDLNAEQAIISLILTNPEQFPDVMDLLEVNDFYNVTNQQIWGVLHELFKEGREFDIVAIKAQIKKQEVSPGPVMKVVVEAYENQVYVGNLNHFIDIVKNKSLLRRIIKAAEGNVYKAQLKDAEAKDVLVNLEKSIIEINEKVVSPRAIDAKGIVAEIKKDIQVFKNTGGKWFKTGFTKLDEYTGGFIPSQSWIVGAYTGTGKTFLILQFMLNVLRQGGNVILFSTEMDRKWNIARLLSNICGISSLDIMRDNIVDEQADDKLQAEIELASFGDRLVIYDNVYTVDEIRLKSKKMQLKQGLNIVFVDYIQNLRGGESLYERMSEAAIGLQQLGQELQVTIVIGSQVPQNAAGWQSKQAIEFKGAGEIAAIADAAIWVQKGKDNESKETRNLILRKVRHGESGTVKTNILFPSGRFVDLDKPDEKEEEGNVKAQI